MSAQIQNGYPKAMHHPNHVKGYSVPVAGTGRMVGGVLTQDQNGVPDVLPPVTVNNADQEEYHRSRGYICAGEQTARSGYMRYPMWMNPPPSTDPSQKPLEAVLVSSEAEEADATAKGYSAPGKPDPEAVQAAVAAPYVPGRQTAEWPKVVNGVVVQDPRGPTGGIQEYPKWVLGELANNSAEESVIRAKHEAPGEVSVPAPAAAPAPVAAPHPLDERAKLLEQAAACNAKIDRRWSNERIREAISQAGKALA